MGTCVSVGIIGLGHVGAHVANSLMLQGTADELLLCDITSGDEDNSKKLAAEVQDLSDSLAFCPHNVRVENCGEDYAALASCDVVVNAAGKVALAAQDRDGELFYTTDTARRFIPALAGAGFDGVWVTVANPCDVVATEIWRLGGFDPRRVIGTGTQLDSARFKHVLSRETGIDQHSIGAYMLGEHGATQFACWSQVNFGGKPLAELEREQPERFSFDRPALEDAARQGGYVAMAGKMCTEYAVADAAARLARAVVSNEHAVLACSTLMDGVYGEEGLFCSVPCVVGGSGVEALVVPDLTEPEQASFHASCAHIRENLSRVGLA